MNDQKSCGVVYLAFGATYLVMALLGVKSLRATNPDLNACIVTNVPHVPPEIFDFWREGDTWLFVEDSTKNNRLYKTSIIDYSPYEKTFFLDCDTIVNGSLDEGFVMLDYFDVAMRLKCEGKVGLGKKHSQDVLRGRLKVRDVPHWNSGALFFRKSEGSALFFDNWSREYNERAFKSDQVSLVDVVFMTDCRVLGLDMRWNSGFGSVLAGDLGAKVVHYHDKLDAVIEAHFMDIASKLSATCSEDIVRETRAYTRKHKWKKRGFMSGLRYYVGRVYRRYWHSRYGPFSAAS